MEDLGFPNPFVESGGDWVDGKDHCGELLIQSQGKPFYEGGFVHDTSLTGDVLEVGDVALKTIVFNVMFASITVGSIFPFEASLGEFRKLKMSSGLSVKGEEHFFEVFGEFVERFQGRGDSGVGHLVIPHFGEGGTSSFAHLVEHGHDLIVLGGVQCGVYCEVGLHGLAPSWSIRGFSRKVGRKGGFELGGFSGHGGRWSDGLGLNRCYWWSYWLAGRYGWHKRLGWKRCWVLGWILGVWSWGSGSWGKTGGCWGIL